MCTLPHASVFFPLHIDNPIGIGFINSNYLPISSPPMAKPARRGRERPARLDPPGRQCPHPEDDSSPTRARLDGSPAGGDHMYKAPTVRHDGSRGSSSSSGVGMSSRTKSSPKMRERRGWAPFKGQGPARRGHSPPPGSQRPQEEEECVGASCRWSGKAARETSGCLSPSLRLSISVSVSEKSAAMSPGPWGGLRERPPSTR